jgi:hypothetical protein
MTDVTEEESVTALIKAMNAAEARRLVSDSMSAPEVLADLSVGDPAAFAREILPVIRQASAASRSGQVSLNGERDEAFGMPPSQEPVQTANDALLIRLAEAVRSASAAGDPDIHAAVRAMAGSDLATEQLLAAAGFASGHPGLLGDAATWLLSGPFALDQGWMTNPRGLSADVLAQVCAQMPLEQTRGIQKRAAAHTAPFEKQHRHDAYGSAAWRLLQGVSDANLTGEAKARKSELARKFAQTSPVAPRLVTDISVRPPIDGGAVKRMSDEHLLNAMRRWSAEEWQPEPSGRLRGGANAFAGVLGAAAQEDPARFTAVLESLPADVNPVYTTHILFGLSRAASPEQSLRAAWAARTRVATSGMQIGQLIERAAPDLDAALLAAGMTEDELLGLLGQLLAQPAVPADEAVATRDRDGDEEPERSAAPEITGEKLAERLMSRALNRPEYAALRALAALAPRFPRAAALLAAQLGLLAGSPVLAVRALAIEMSPTLFTTDPDAVTAITAIVAKALDTVGVAADAEPDPLPAAPRILLAGFHLRSLLFRAHYDVAAPVLDRMISFYDTTAADDGATADLTAAASQAAFNAAMIAAVAAYRDPRALTLTLTQQLASRQLPFRRGITAALSQLLPLGGTPGELAAVLIGFFDDADDDLARLAGSTLMRLPAGHDELAGRLLAAACQAKTFTLEPAQVVTAADQYNGDIPGTVLAIAERFFDLHQSQASDLRGSGAHAASVLGRTVVGIYVRETQNPQLASRTLNLIDSMVLARSYGLEEQLAKLDR